LVLVTYNRQSCLDPTAVQETEILSPYAASVQVMHKIQSFSVKYIQLQMQIKLLYSVTATLLSVLHLTNTHTHTHMDCTVEDDGPIVLVIDE